MNKEMIKQFFDDYAPTWDAEMIKSEEVVEKILDNACVSENVDVLDVACGTGVLFDNYINRKVSSIVGIDISDAMIEIAKEKYLNDVSKNEGSDIELLCADAEIFSSEKKFDVVMVYNAFPHFPNQRELIKNLASLLKEGGRLSIAHGMSREKIIEHHSGAAKDVSLELLEAKELATLMSEFLSVNIILSNDEMYQVVGMKN